MIGARRHANDGTCEPIAAVLNEGVQAMAMQTDFSRGREIASVVEHSVETFGRIDRLLNNAGAIRPPAHGEHRRDATGVQTRYVHVQSAHQLINTMAPGRRGRARGAMVHMTSVYGTLGAGPVMADTTAKAGLMHLPRLLAKDLAPDVRVNAVAQGHRETDRSRAAGAGCIASVVPATL